MAIVLKKLLREAVKNIFWPEAKKNMGKNRSI